MTENNNNVRFFYMRDSKDPRRMVTVARRFHPSDRSVLQFQFAVNNPNSKFDGWDSTKGDCPQKAVGRKIALGRLESRPFEVDFESGRQLTLICEILSDESKAEMHAVDWGQRWNDSEKGDFVPSTVRRIARQELARLVGDEPLIKNRPKTKAVAYVNIGSVNPSDVVKLVATLKGGKNK